MHTLLYTYKYVAKITKEKEAAWEGVKEEWEGESNIIPFYLTTYLKKERERNQQRNGQRFDQTQTEIIKE